jgi:branched-chain amino acid transport system permease protein
MSHSRVGLALVLASIVLLPVAAGVFEQPFWIAIGTRILIVAIAVISLDLVVGHAGLPSFGHAAYFGVGGFTVGILSVHAAADPSNAFLQIVGNEAAVSWPIAVLVAGLVGLVFGALALRTRGVHFLMITLAFAQMLYYLFVSLPTYGGDEGVRMRSMQRLLGQDISNPLVFYYVVAVLLILTIFGMRALMVSRFGRVLASCRQNERRTRFLGYRTNVYLLVAFAMSAAGAGLAGALMANHLRYVSPQMLSWFQSGEFLIMNVLGGLATSYGGFLGAAAYIVLHETFLSFTEYWEVVLGIGLLVLVFANPGGLSRLLADRR